MKTFRKGCGCGKPKGTTQPKPKTPPTPSK
jgi:hypothetical protein